MNRSSASASSVPAADRLNPRPGPIETRGPGPASSPAGDTGFNPEPIGVVSRRRFAGQAVAAVGVFGLGFRVAAAERAPVRHRFLCCDYQGNKVAIVAMDGSIEWEFPAQTPQDCWSLPNGNVLFCERGGAKEVSPRKEVVWEYAAPAEAQCHSCQPLRNGRVLVAECGMSRLIEAGRDGRIAREIKVASQARNMGHQFRGTRQTADDHYWVCLMDEKKVAELSPEGTLLREIPVDGFPHEAIRLPNGHLLVTLGDTGRVIELDQDLKTVWALDKDEIPGNPLRLPAGCQRLPNGNTIICNYLPGPFMGKQPQAFEVTRTKEVVWEFADHSHFKTVNQVYLLDLPDRERRGAVLR